MNYLLYNSALQCQKLPPSTVIRIKNPRKLPLTLNKTAIILLNIADPFWTLC